jgi:hypothetical protein
MDFEAARLAEGSGEMWRHPFAALDAPALPPVLQP